jgi:hypothetical protein
VSITKRERFSLLAVRSVFVVLQGTPFHDDIGSVMAKLEQRMNDKERAELGSFGARFIYMPDHGTKSYAGKEDIIDAIQRGIRSRKVVRYRYADARGRVRQGHLAPYGMVLHRHGLYVTGARLKDVDADAPSAEMGVFAIERFAEADTYEHTTSLRHRSSTSGACYMVRSVLTLSTQAGCARWSSSSPVRKQAWCRRAPGTQLNESTRFPMAASA